MKKSVKNLIALTKPSGAKQSTAIVEAEQPPYCHPELVSGSVNLIETKQTDRFRIKSGMTERGFLGMSDSKMLNQVQHDKLLSSPPFGGRVRERGLKTAFTLA